MASFVFRRGTAAALAAASAVGLVLAVQVVPSAVEGRERAPSDLQPLEGKPGAVLKGRVVLKGDAPDVAALSKQLAAAMAQSRDKATCYDSAPEVERIQPAWVFGKDGGVGNVVVWIQPPEGYFFKVDLEKNKTWPDAVELKQPHCAFIPHVSWIMPQLVDPKDPAKNIPSGQKFLISNTSPISQNVKWDSNTSDTGQLGTLPANTQAKEVSLKADNAVYQFSNNIHPWMYAYVWVFNHPYAAVTDANGDYEIKNVPVGSKVHITAWHEMGPYSHFLTPEKIKGEEIELKDGENVHDFTLDVNAK